MLKRIISLAIVWALIGSGLFTCAIGENQAAPVFKSVSVHDPSIIKADDGYYYIYGSHMAAARSIDLVSWESISRDATNSGCTLFENVQTELKEALSWAKTKTFWAPDVQKLNDGRYYYYYCACEGSQPLSALGVAVSDNPEGPYEDLGIFLKSGAAGYNSNYYPNAVDPHTFFDKEGKLWMVYGSYSGGIFILEMDPQTGFPFEGQGYGKKLLGKNHSRIEAPYILYSPDTEYYYLFLSFGGLNANDGYNIRVCRSKNPDGPYEDALGQDMIKCGGKAGTFFNDPDYVGYGVKLMGGYKFELAETDTNRFVTAYRSPGHNSAYYDEETGRYFIVFHTRYANSGESHSIRVHQMYMNDQGWPVVSPVRYAGEDGTLKEGSAADGNYKLIFHERDINSKEHVSVFVSLNKDGTITGAKTGAWTLTDENSIQLTIGQKEYTARLATAWDQNAQSWVTVLTGLDQEGAALWGIRYGE